MSIELSDISIIVGTVDLRNNSLMSYMMQTRISALEVQQEYETDSSLEKYLLYLTSWYRISNLWRSELLKWDSEKSYEYGK